MTSTFRLLFPSWLSQIPGEWWSAFLRVLWVHRVHFWKTAGHRFPRMLVSILKPNHNFSLKHHVKLVYIIHQDLSRHNESRGFSFLKNCLLSGFHVSQKLVPRGKMSLNTVTLWGHWGHLWGLWCVCKGRGGEVVFLWPNSSFCWE